MFKVEIKFNTHTRTHARTHAHTHTHTPHTHTTPHTHHTTHTERKKEEEMSNEVKDTPDQFIITINPFPAGEFVLVVLFSPKNGPKASLSKPETSGLRHLFLMGMHALNTGSQAAYTITEKANGTSSASGIKQHPLGRERVNQHYLAGQRRQRCWFYTVCQEAGQMHKQNCR